MILWINKIIKWIVIIIEIIEKEIWVNICFKVVNIIKRGFIREFKLRIEYIIGFIVFFLEDLFFRILRMLLFGFELRCFSIVF